MSRAYYFTSGRKKEKTEKERERLCISSKLIISPVAGKGEHEKDTDFIFDDKYHFVQLPI